MHLKSGIFITSIAFLMHPCPCPDSRVTFRVRRIELTMHSELSFKQKIQMCCEILKKKKQQKNVVELLTSSYMFYMYCLYVSITKITMKIQWNLQLNMEYKIYAMFLLMNRIRYSNYFANPIEVSSLCGSIRGSRAVNRMPHWNGRYVFNIPTQRKEL